MNLNDLSEFWQRNRKRVLFLILLFLLGGGATLLWRLDEKNGTSKPANGEGGVPALAFAGDTWKISGQVDSSKLTEASFPQETTIYKITEAAVGFTEQQALEIAERFGFEPEVANRVSLPGGERMFVFAEEETNLAVFSYPRETRYTFKNIVAKTLGVGGTLFDQAAATQKAQEYLESKRLPTSDLVVLSTRYLIYSVETATQTQNPKRANALELAFSRTAGGHKILGRTISEPPVKIVFNRTGEIISLSYKESDWTLKEDKIVSLLSLAEATERLKEGGTVFSILPSEGGQEDFIETGDLTSFTPESARLVYYQIHETDLLVPIYLFEGKGMIADIEVIAHVVLSAIKP